MNKETEIAKEAKEGKVYTRWFPFTRESTAGDDHGAPYSIGDWNPGFKKELIEPDGGEANEVWDGDGEELRCVISIHKPGKFPVRVFYTRRWRDPDGRVFGQANLRVTTLQTFNRWLRGERWPSNSKGGATARQKYAETVSWLSK